MLIGAFVSWWYGPGWKLLLDSLPLRIKGVAETFSVGQLSRSMFAPWRRIITYPGNSLDAKVRALADNAFSRMIGFVVRLGVMVAAFVTLLFISVITVVELVVWPVIPALPVVLLIAGAVV